MFANHRAPGRTPQLSRLGNVGEGRAGMAAGQGAAATAQTVLRTAFTPQLYPCPCQRLKRNIYEAAGAERGADPSVQKNNHKAFRSLSPNRVDQDL